ncbi:MAG TPA: peptidylprolyl isomerase [Rickettsiales bacterium]|nr:peptidylprolyl isomerase [Rickettsiales bacterium]
MKNTVLTLSAAALLFALPAHAQDTTHAEKTKQDYVILKVGSDDIKRSEVDAVWKSIFPGGNPPDFDTFEQKIKDNVLRGVASEHIVEKEAEKAGVQNDPEVKERIAAAEKQIVIQEFLKQKAKQLVTDDKLKALYAERTKTPEEEVHALHILVKTKEEAEALEKKLKKGANFEELAKKNSTDPSSVNNGGDLGWFTKDKMVPEFSQAAFSLKPGQVSDPIKSDFGWHIIKVEGRRQSTPPSFDQMKSHLAQELGNKVVGDYINDLMKGEKVTAYDASGKSRELPALPAPEAAPSKPAAAE